jgi:hypothetical protein
VLYIPLWRAIHTLLPALAFGRGSLAADVFSCSGGAWLAASRLPWELSKLDLWRSSPQSFRFQSLISSGNVVVVVVLFGVFKQPKAA